MPDPRPTPCLTSPLSGFGVHLCGVPPAASPGVRIRSLPGLAKIAVKIGNARPSLATAVQEAVGLTLPARGAVGRDGQFVLAVAPGEWLLLVAAESRQRVLDKLRTGLAGGHSALIDLSSGSHAVDVRGKHAETLLQKGISIDLSLNAFGLGSAARSKFDGFPVSLVRSASDGFLLLVPRSYAWSFAITLVTLAADYGVGFEESAA